MRLIRNLAVVLLFVSILGIASDQGDPIRTRIKALEAELATVAKRPTAAGLDGVQTKLASIAKDIETASGLVSDSFSKRGKQIAGFGRSWLRLQTGLYSIHLIRYHKGEERLGEADEIARMTVRVNKDASYALVQELPFNVRHVSADKVEFFLLEQDKQVAEYGAIAAAGGSLQYTKMIQFASVRSLLVNRWALRRMGFAQGEASINSCGPLLSSFRVRNGRVTEGSAYLELGMGDRYQDWMDPSLQSAVRAATLKSPVGSAKRFRHVLESSFEKTPEFRNFAFDLTTAEQEKFIDEASKLIAAADEDNWAAQSDDIIARTVFAGDDLNIAKIAGRIAEDAFESRVRYVVDQAWAILGQQVGIEQRSLVEKAFARAIGDGKEWRAAVESRVLAALAPLDNPTASVERKKSRMREKMTQIFETVEPFIRVSRDLELVEGMAEGSEKSQDQVPPSSLRLGARVSNPAELKDQLLAMIELPRYKKYKNYVEQGQTSKILQDFFIRVAKDFSASKKPDLEAIARKHALALVAANPAKTEVINPNNRYNTDPRDHRVVVADNTRVVLPPVIIQSPGVGLRDVFGLLNLPGSAARPQFIRTYIQHYAHNHAKVSKLIAVLPALQIKWIDDADRKLPAGVKLAPGVLGAKTGAYVDAAGRPYYPSPVRERTAIEHLGRKALTAELKVDRTKAWNIVWEMLSRASKDDSGKLETFCQANLLNPKGDEAFRKMFRSSPAIREALMAAFPKFESQDSKLIEQTKSGMERFFDKLQIVFLIIGAVALVIGAVVFTCGAASVAAPAVLTMILSFTGEVMFPLTVANLVTSLEVSFIEKPAALAYQEAIANSTMASALGAPQSVNSGAFTSNNAFFGGLQSPVTTREHVQAAWKELRTEQTWTTVFAALDAIYIGHTIKSVTGLKALKSWTRLSGAIGKGVIETQVPKAAKNLAQNVRETVKPNLMTQTREVARKVFKGEAFAWFRPAVRYAEAEAAFIRKAGSVLGNDLSKAIQETEKFSTLMSSRLDKVGRLRTRLTGAEIAAHPEMTWYGNTVRLLTGRLGKTKFPAYDWFGLTPVTELEALRQGKALSWFERWGAVRDDLMKLRGNLIKKEVVEPAETLLQKMRSIQGSSVSEFKAMLARSGALTEEIQAAGELTSRGELLMMSLTKQERQVLRRISQGESLIKRFAYVYKFQTTFGFKALGELNPVFKDASVVMGVAQAENLGMSLAHSQQEAVSAYEPRHYVEMVDGEPGAELVDQAQGQLYRHVGAEGFDPLAENVAREDLKNYLDFLLSFEGAAAHDAETEALIQQIRARLAG